VPEQLSLRINLNDDATFENFFLQQQDSRHQVVTVLQDQFCSNGESFIYLWGASGSGVSHLLQASCHQASSQGLTAQYLPLSELLDYPPQQLLENLEQLSLVCLDDLQIIAGNQQWETALFDLYNRIREAGGHLLLGANCSARELPLQLPDLQSRFGWGPVFLLPEANDEEKIAILQFRASRRGMELGDDVAQFLINRAARGLGELMSCLETLDEASLEAKRKLSIPFVKQVFGW
jgi:DnaA family protein